MLLANCPKYSAAYYLWIKTCKRYFKSALKVQDEHRCSIYVLSRLYLSALYYESKTGYEKALEHVCAANDVMASTKKPRNQMIVYHTLLFVDKVAIVCGVWFLFSYVRRRIAHKEATTSVKFSSHCIVQCLMLLLRANCQTEDGSLENTCNWESYHLDSYLYSLCLHTRKAISGERRVEYCTQLHTAKTLTRPICQLPVMSHIRSY